MGNRFLSNTLKVMSKLIISLLVLAVFANVVEASHKRKLANVYKCAICTAGLMIPDCDEHCRRLAPTPKRKLQNCGNCMTHDCNNCRTLNPGNDAACKERCSTSCQVCRGGSNESTTHDAGCTPGLPMYNMVCTYWPAK